MNDAALAAFHASAPTDLIRRANLFASTAAITECGPEAEVFLLLNERRAAEGEFQAVFSFGGRAAERRHAASIFASNCRHYSAEHVSTSRTDTVVVSYTPSGC